MTTNPHRHWETDADGHDRLVVTLCTESVDIRPRTSPEACTEAGDAYYDRRLGGWWLVIPGDDSRTFWPTQKQAADSPFGQCGSEIRNPVWRWDGSEERPTLSPSLHLKAAGQTVWHGFLRAGRLQSC